ncbi:MAG TPA: HIT domain-containing protein [Candidatus Saccharimonadales bacterium]|nr:HIT domain-containing protein [Candidatus Saccharimonadales bacterium]
MFNHEPENYDCPFCNLLAGHESKFNQLNDIVYQNEYATATIAPKWWINNPGHVLVIPNKHFENIYDIPEEYLTEVYNLVKRVAIAIRSTYGCEGTSTRQHNEPAGNQDVWHLHVHLYPRYTGDGLYKNHENTRFAEPDERLPYAEKLRKFLAEYSSKG